MLQAMISIIHSPTACFVGPWEKEWCLSARVSVRPERLPERVSKHSLRRLPERLAERCVSRMLNDLGVLLFNFVEEEGGEEQWRTRNDEPAAKVEPAGLKAPLQREPPDDAGLDAGCRRKET